MTSWAMRGLAVVGLVVSCLLAVEYAVGGGVCQVDGCSAVRASAWARPLGVPLPAVGVGYFALLLAAMTRGSRWLRPVALVGGLGAVGLVGIQTLLIGAVCPLCMVVDAAAIGVAVLVWRGASTARLSAWWYGAYAGAAAAAVTVALFMSGSVHETHALASAPAPVAAPHDDHGGDDGHGRATIVKFADFRCPHCRTLHERLAPLLDEAGDAISLVLRPGLISAESVPAAKTFCCAELLAPDRAPAVAHALFEATRLDEQSCLDIGAGAGLDRAALAACVASERADERLAEHLDAAADAGVRAFPTTWFGSERVVGAPSVDELRSLIARAIATADAG